MEGLLNRDRDSKIETGAADRVLHQVEGSDSKRFLS